MSCNHNDLLQLAKQLVADQNCSEVVRRCAASRGYYASLHLSSVMFPPDASAHRGKDESSHAFIIRCIKRYAAGPNPGRLVAAKIAAQMANMKRLRNRADYEIDEEFSMDDVEKMMVRAESIIASCDEVESRRVATAQA